MKKPNKDNEEYNQGLKKIIQSKVKSIINKFKKFNMMDNIQTTRSNIKFPIHIQSRPVTGTLSARAIQKTYNISRKPSMSPNHDNNVQSIFKVPKQKHTKGAISMQIPKKFKNLNEETILNLVHEKKETGFYVNQINYNECSEFKHKHPPKSARVLSHNIYDQTKAHLVNRMESPFRNISREKRNQSETINSKLKKREIYIRQISYGSNSNLQQNVNISSLTSSKRHEKCTRNKSMKNVLLSKFNQKLDDEPNKKNISRQNSKLNEKRHSHLNVFKLQLHEQSERMKNLLGDLKRRQSMSEDLLKNYTINLKIEQIKKRKGSQYGEMI